MTQNVPDQLVNSTALQGKLRCTLFALCNVLCGSPESPSRSPALGLSVTAAILLNPLLHLGWIQPSLTFLLTASDLSLVSAHHPCNFCLCSVCHAQSEADLPVGLAFRNLKARRFSNTDLQEPPPLHQVLVSDRRGSRSWSLVAQCEQREMLAPASSPHTLKAKVLSICKGSRYTRRGQFTLKCSVRTNPELFRSK